MLERIAVSNLLPKAVKEKDGREVELLGVLVPPLRFDIYGQAIHPDPKQCALIVGKVVTDEMRKATQ